MGTWIITDFAASALLRTAFAIWAILYGKWAWQTVDILIFHLLYVYNIATTAVVGHDRLTQSHRMGPDTAVPIVTTGECGA